MSDFSTVHAKRHASLLQTEVVVVLLNVAMYAACYSAQVPVLPYLMKSLQADVSAYGKLTTLFSVIQTIGGILSGPLMDRYGSKTLLLISFAASCLCYALTASATNMLHLYASRIPTLFQHAMLGARVMISLASREEDRAAVLGYIGVAYSVGSVSGPVLGGYATLRAGPKAASWLAAAGSAISVLSVIAYLPGLSGVNRSAQGEGPQERLSNAASAEADPTERTPSKGKHGAFTSARGLWSICTENRALDLIAIQAVSGFAVGSLQYILPLVLLETFELSVVQNGLVMSFLGAVGFLVQGLLIGWLTLAFAERKVVMGALWGMAISCVGLALCTGRTAVVLLLVPLTACHLVVSNVNTSLLTKAVPAQLAGSVLAADMSVGSAVSIVTPGVATWLLTQYHFGSVATCSGGLVALLLFLMHAGLVQAHPSKDKAS